MNADCEYQYMLDLRRRKDGSPIGTATVEPDFHPLREYARLAALRRGYSQPGSYEASVVIEPRWHERLGAPYISGLRALVRPDGTEGFPVDSETDFFATSAREAASQFVEKGVLEEGDEFFCVVAAFRREGKPPTDFEPQRFRFEAAPTALAVKESAFAAFQLRSTSVAHTNDTEMPVFFRASIPEEIIHRTREAGEVETGGVLIGYLRWDKSFPEVFADVTAQIPAMHVDADSARLTFTADTWTAARAALQLRGQGEVLLGWWHSHPTNSWKCDGCSEEKWKKCERAKGFLSAYDKALHRTVFARAFHTALVATSTPDSDVNLRLFGWKAGVLAARGYRLLDPRIDR